MTTPALSRLPSDATAATAADWLGDIVFTLGPGFHPDTPASDYVNVQTGEPSFDTFVAEGLDKSLSVAFSLLGARVYEESCWFAWRLLHGLPRQAVHDARWHLIAALQHLDPQGAYTDERMFSDGQPPMTIEDAHLALSALIQPAQE